MLADEKRRLAALTAIEILDTDPEEIFDRVTGSIAKTLSMPIVLVSFVDKSRQWFKSIVGLEVNSTPRSISFCTYAIQKPELFIVEDALSDERFHQNPLVTGDPFIRFYAGAPLTIKYDSIDHMVGTLCVIDRVPRELTPHEELYLKSMARQVNVQLKLRFAKQSYNNFMKKYGANSSQLVSL